MRIQPSAKGCFVVERCVPTCRMASRLFWRGALQGLEPLSLSIGYAACAAALGAAAAAAAEMKPHCDAEEVRQFFMISLGLIINILPVFFGIPKCKFVWWFWGIFPLLCQNTLKGMNWEMNILKEVHGLSNNHTRCFFVASSNLLDFEAS